MTPATNAIANVTRPRVKMVGKTLVGQAQYTTIQAAINAAAADPTPPSATAPYTIEIFPGIYTEVITCSTYVNLKGIGPKGAVVIQQTDATIITLATQVQIENLTVRLVTPTDIRNLIVDGTPCLGVKLISLVIEITTPAAYGNSFIRFNQVSECEINNCSYSIGGTGTISGINIQAAATITILNCNFVLTNVNSFHLKVSDGVVSCMGTKWSGTGATLYATSGNLMVDNCALLSPVTPTWSSASAIFRNCELSFSMVVNSGSMRFKNCSYRSVVRSGSGKLVDESPYALSSIYHVLKKTWEALIASANIATRTAGTGSVTSGGGGQVVLHTHDDAADAAGVEWAADAAGGLASTFDYLKCPRYVQQISVSAFRATTDMFFGLRATPGAAVPDMNEKFAGFIWDGANFHASSSNGAGVGVADHCTTPTVGVSVQLEMVIRGTGGVEFYIDGVLVFTHATAAGRPDSSALKFQEYVISDGGGGATTSDITLREGFLQECP